MREQLTELVVSPTETTTAPPVTSTSDTDDGTSFTDTDFDTQQQSNSMDDENTAPSEDTALSQSTFEVGATLFTSTSIPSIGPSTEHPSLSIEDALNSNAMQDIGSEKGTVAVMLSHSAVYTAAEIAIVAVLTLISVLLCVPTW